MGDDVIITTVENVAENSDSERVITSLAVKMILFLQRHLVI